VHAQAHDSEPAGEWISYHDELPLTCEPCGELDVARIEHLHDRNLRTLATVGTLEERRKRGEQAGAAELEIERLHHKVDLLLDLTATLLRLQLRLPEPVALRLSREGVCWHHAGAPPALGARVQVSIHLHPCAVNPLTWPATIIRIAGDEVCARFDELGEAQSAALEKHVFMHHRRSVAGSRQPAPR
jgi:hypothetical protein